jgi:hypothetical protein
VTPDPTIADRQRDILAVLGRVRTPLGAVAVCRLLNLDAPCSWCPVFRPRPGTQTAVVSERSRCRVERVLKSLLAQGLVKRCPVSRTAAYMVTT